ncbi:hypothetical protein [Clostridium perfringens]|jgi:hypothetical protein|uniref:Uncharacterized protein n=1 Tax=Clostridium perfringens TaxID=1502 RepID=A0AAW4IZM5_CLOPF|nr:hypothetical protein [Clostridium perfringens]MBO3356219.1 hypothetical protein [Clostridium perfringens]MBO3359440.1 hypothetical protein [Clostridium perfringens]
MDNKEINTKDLLGIELRMGRNTIISLPKESLEIYKIKNGEFGAYINISSAIQYKSTGTPKQYPFDRIKEYDDIQEIILIYTEGNIKYKPLFWENPNPYIDEEENKYQTSEKISWDRLHLEISKDVLKRKIQSMKDQATQLLQQAEELELSIA